MPRHHKQKSSSPSKYHNLDKRLTNPQNHFDLSQKEQELELSRDALREKLTKAREKLAEKEERLKRRYKELNQDYIESTSSWNDHNEDVNFPKEDTNDINQKRRREYEMRSQGSKPSKNERNERINRDKQIDYNERKERTTNRNLHEESHVANYHEGGNNRSTSRDRSRNSKTSRRSFNDSRQNEAKEMFHKSDRRSSSYTSRQSWKDQDEQIIHGVGTNETIDNSCHKEINEWYHERINQFEKNSTNSLEDSPRTTRNEHRFEKRSRWTNDDFAPSPGLNFDREDFDDGSHHYERDTKWANHERFGPNELSHTADAHRENQDEYYGEEMVVDEDRRAAFLRSTKEDSPDRDYDRFEERIEWQNEEENIRNGTYEDDQDDPRLVIDEPPEWNQDERFEIQRQNSQFEDDRDFDGVPIESDYKDVERNDQRRRGRNHKKRKRVTPPVKISFEIKTSKQTNSWTTHDHFSEEVSDKKMPRLPHEHFRGDFSDKKVPYEHLKEGKVRLGQHFGAKTPPDDCFQHNSEQENFAKHANHKVPREQFRSDFSNEKIGINQSYSGTPPNDNFQLTSSNDTPNPRIPHENFRDDFADHIKLKQQNFTAMPRPPRDHFQHSSNADVHFANQTIPEIPHQHSREGFPDKLLLNQQNFATPNSYLQAETNISQFHTHYELQNIKTSASNSSHDSTGPPITFAAQIMKPEIAEKTPEELYMEQMPYQPDPFVPKFGKSLLTVQEMLDILKHRQKHFNWSETETKFQLITKLEGRPRRWMLRNNNVFKNWPDLSREFLYEFRPRMEFCDNLQEMLNCIKKPGETYKSYFDRKINLLQKCSILGTKAVSCLIGGLRPHTLRTELGKLNLLDPSELLILLNEKYSFNESTFFIQIDQHSVLAYNDLDAEHVTVQEEYAKRMGIIYKDIKTPLIGSKGVPIVTNGEAIAQISLNGINIDMKIFIVPNSCQQYPVALGNSFRCHSSVAYDAKTGWFSRKNEQENLANGNPI